VRRALVTLVLLFGTVAAACGGDGADDAGGTDDDAATPTGADDASEVIDLTLGVFPGAWPNINDFVAQEQGIFEDHGLRVEMVELATGPDQINAVSSGSIDVASNAPANFMIPNSRGQDLVGLVNVINAPLYSWVAQADWPTPNADEPYPAPVRDFEGARIGITGQGAEVHLFTQALLRDAGLDDADVTFVNVGGVPTGVAAFAADQTDIHVAFEPAQTLLTNDFEGKIVLDLRAGEGPEVFRDVSGQIRGAVRGTVEDDPEKFRRYQAATEEVIEFIRDPANHDAVVESFSSYTSLERELIGTLVENNRETLESSYSCTGHDALARFEVEAEQFPESAVQPCEEFFWEGAEAYLVD
jgi:NitT/TauT family transport system substrate-binding protein